MNALILASASPRRVDLLRLAGLEIEQHPAHSEEASIEGEPLEAMVIRLAKEKAQAVSARFPGRWVLGADTLVEGPEGQRLGKPADDLEAFTMLRQLSGQKHRVWSGVAVLRDGLGPSFAEGTDVYFRELSKRECQAYVEGGEGRDKAGAYGIQGEGGKFVLRLAGSYHNVVGLPLAQVLQHLEDLGLYP